jgi:hypothetical protein
MSYKIVIEVDEKTDKMVNLAQTNCPYDDPIEARIHTEKALKDAYNTINWENWAYDHSPDTDMLQERCQEPGFFSPECF